MANNRAEKINQEVKRELSVVIREMKDDRIPLMTSVVKVNVTPDLKFAKAFISIMASEEEKIAAIKALSNGSGFIRREMAHNLKLRYTPEFTFELDNSIETGAHINQLLHQVLKKDEQ